MPKLLNQQKNRAAPNDLSVSALATIYGCCGLFDLCSDADLMSLSFQGAEPFLDWIGWERTDVCRIKKNFITYVAPAGTQDGSPTSSVTADPCAEPNTVEYGVCDFTLEDFGRLREAGPVRDITMNDVRLCEAQPRYRLDGVPITDDMEYDMRLATEVIMQDFKRLTITGAKETGGQWDGLEALVKTNHISSTGIHCHSMDSNIIDWNANNLDGGAGITWNGVAQPATKGIIDFLMAAWRLDMQRIGWSPALAAQSGMGANVDAVLVLPSYYIDCILNLYTCWRVCPGGQYNETNLNSLEARAFRSSLDGGRFGAGKIYLHSKEIALLPYDWGLVKGPTRFDMYFLVGAVGNIKTIQGQYLDLSKVPSKTNGEYDVTDGGRLLTWINRDQTCIERVIEMRPRLLSWAPFLQTRFQDVKCDDRLGPQFLPDPLETSFRVETSLSVANCP